MNYVLSTKPEVRKMLRDKILSRLRIELSQVTEYMENHKLSPPTWSTYMIAITILNGDSSTCQICGSPMTTAGSGRFAYPVCSLFPVHSFVRNEIQLGGKCVHELYLCECEQCLDVEAKKPKPTMQDWLDQHREMEIKWI